MANNYKQQMKLDIEAAWNPDTDTPFGERRAREYAQVTQTQQETMQKVAAKLRALGHDEEAAAIMQAATVMEACTQYITSYQKHCRDNKIPAISGPKIKGLPVPIPDLGDMMVQQIRQTIDDKIIEDILKTAAPKTATQVLRQQETLADLTASQRRYIDELTVNSSMKIIKATPLNAPWKMWTPDDEN